MYKDIDRKDINRKDIDRKDINRKAIDRKDIQLKKIEKKECYKYCPSVHFALLNGFEADSGSLFFYLLPIVQEADYSAVYCPCGFDVTQRPTLAEKLRSFC